MINSNNTFKNFFIGFTIILIVASCQSTQKTTGEGLISVVAQNVLKLAGNQAIKGADFSSVNNVKVKVEHFLRVHVLHEADFNSLGISSRVHNVHGSFVAVLGVVVREQQHFTGTLWVQVHRGLGV